MSRLKSNQRLNSSPQKLRLKNPGEWIVVIGHSYAGSVILLPLKTDSTLADAVVALQRHFFNLLPVISNP